MRLLVPLQGPSFLPSRPSRPVGGKRETESWTQRSDVLRCCSENRFEFFISLPMSVIGVVAVVVVVVVVGFLSFSRTCLSAYLPACRPMRPPWFPCQQNIVVSICKPLDSGAEIGTWERKESQNVVTCCKLARLSRLCLLTGNRNIRHYSTIEHKETLVDQRLRKFRSPPN